MLKPVRIIFYSAALAVFTHSFCCCLELLTCIRGTCLIGCLCGAVECLRNTLAVGSAVWSTVYFVELVFVRVEHLRDRTQHCSDVYLLVIIVQLVPPKCKSTSR